MLIQRVFVQSMLYYISTISSSFVVNRKAGIAGGLMKECDIW